MIVPELPCTDCGAPLGPNASFGKCGSCLLHEALDVDSETPSQPSLRDFRLGREIGRGAMGIVYEAQQLSLKRTVALKMLSPMSGAVPEVAERMKLEAETAASLNHPNIVSIYTVGECDGLPFFAMELIEGKPLDKLLGERTARPSKEECRLAAQWMITIAEAVDFAHRHGVLHRDLKPSNVLIDLDGNPHLSDFGLSKLVGKAAMRTTMPGMAIGTPAYMSPEAASGKTDQISVASDVYSLGAMLYELITGEPPFSAETPIETLRQVIHAEPASPLTLNSRVDSRLAIICLKCLEKDPKNRYSDAKSLAEDLERYLRGEPIAAQQAGRLERLWRFCLREPLLASLMAIVILSLSIAAMFGALAYRSSQQRLEDSESLRQRQFTALLNRIEKEWAEPESAFIRLDAQEISAISGAELPVEGNEMHLSLGVYESDFSRRPNRMIGMYIPVISYLRNSMTNPAVIFDLTIYKSYSKAIEALGRSEVHLMHINGVAYVQLRDNAGLKLLCKDTYYNPSFLAAVVFTHKESGIKSLSSSRGRSLALPLDDAFISPILAEAQLFAEGLRARDFAAITNLRTSEIISQVRDKTIDIGVSELKTVGQLIVAGAPLVVLREFETPGNVWVSTSKLSKSLTSNLMSSLINLKDTNILAGLEPGLTGFASAPSDQYEATAMQLKKAAHFKEK